MEKYQKGTLHAIRKIYNSIKSVDEKEMQSFRKEIEDRFDIMRIK